MSKVIAHIFVVAIDFYRVTFAGVLGGRCRYTPSCSCYAREAVLKLGLRRGLFRAARRVCRCHPWGGQGFDPVK